MGSSKIRHDQRASETRIPGDLARNLDPEAIAAFQKAIELSHQVQSLRAALREVRTPIGTQETRRAIGAALHLAETAAVMLQGYIKYGELWGNAEKIVAASNVLDGSEPATRSGADFAFAFDMLVGAVWARNPPNDAEDIAEQLRETYSARFGSAFSELDLNVTAERINALRSEEARFVEKARREKTASVDIHKWRRTRASAAVRDIVWPIVDKARRDERLHDWEHMRFPTADKESKAGLLTRMQNADLARLRRGAKETARQMEKSALTATPKKHA